MFKKINSEAYFFMFFPSLILLSILPFIADSFILPRMLFIILVIFFFVLKTNKIQFNFYSIVYFALAFISLISITYTINISETIFSSIFYIFLALLIVHIQIVSQNKVFKTNLTKGFIISSILIITLTGIELCVNKNISLKDVESFKYMRSLLGHKNIHSASLVLLLPFSLYGFFSFNKWFKFFSSVSILFSIVIILFLQARSSYLALVGMLLVLVAFFTVSSLKNSYKNFKPIIYIGILVSLFFVIFMYYKNPFQLEFIAVINKRFQSIFSYAKIASESNKTIHERFFLWKGTIQIIRDNFFFGIGAGNWKILFPFEGLEYSRAELGKIIFQRPHNDFLWVFSETGILSFILYLSIFIKSITDNLRNIFKLNASRNSKLISLFILSGITAYFIIANFSFPKENVFLSFIFISYLSFSNHNQKNLFAKNNLVVKKISLLFLIFLVSFVTFYRTINSYYLQKAKMFLSTNQWNKTINSAQKASSFFYNLSNTSTPVKWYEGVAWSNLNNYTNAKLSFEEALKHNPSHLQTINNLASSYEFLNLHQQAYNMYDSALKFSPLFYESIINISAIAYNQNKLERCFHYLSRIDTKQIDVDERYFYNLDLSLKAIINKLFEEEKINALNKQILLKNKNFLNATFIKSNGNYEKFLHLIVDTSKNNKDI